MNEYSETTAGKDSPRAEWGYASGRVNVLETLLLNRNFYETLLKSRSLSELRSIIAKTPYRTVFTSDEHLRDFYSALDLYSDAVTEEIYKITPTHTMKDYFDLSSRYLSFRTLFLRACSRGANANEIESTFDALAESPLERKFLENHISELRNRESPQQCDSVSRSIFLDSAICTLRLELADSVGEELVRKLLHDLAVLKCWSAVLRSRWNGTSAEVLRRWFIVPERYQEMVKNTSTLAESNPVSPLSGNVSESVLQKLKNLGVEAIRNNVDASSGEAIQDVVLENRMVAYGPERVAAFLVAFSVEQENLRLALASVINGVEPSIVSERFRREYA